MQRVNNRVKISLLSHFSKKKKNIIRAMLCVGLTYTAVMVGFAIIGQVLAGAYLCIVSLLFVGYIFLLIGPETIFKYRGILKSDVFSLEDMLKETHFKQLQQSLQKLEKDEVDELLNIDLDDDDLAYISHCITDKGTITHDDIFSLYTKYNAKYSKTINFNAFAQEYSLHDTNTNTHQNNVNAIAKIATPAVQHTQTFNSRNTL